MPQVFSPGDPIFRGHFPGNPIVPGVILTEALAQTAGIAGAWVQGPHVLALRDPELEVSRSRAARRTPHPERPPNR
jgi:hypothetical protein